MSQQPKAKNNLAKTRLDNIFNTYLYYNEARGKRPYSFYPDMNGKFILLTIDTDDINLEGVYSFVTLHLSLTKTSTMTIFIFMALLMIGK